MGGPVEIRLSPPLEFIHAQSGAFQEALANLEPLWEGFAHVMAEIGSERFSTHGYGEWPELAASTLAEKSAHGWPLDPLVRTGAMRADLTDPAKGSRDVGPQSFSWGTGQPYAHFHQDGGSVAGRPPQRKIIDIRVDDRRKLERAQVTWINQVAADTWGKT